MDIWMVAVAAGAGYIAKHFKKLKQARMQNISESPFEVSTSEFDGEKGVNSSNHEGNSVFSSSLYPNLGDVEGIGDFLLHKPSIVRSRMLLRNRRKMGRAIRPLSSLETCVMAQLYTENIQMKEYMSNSVSMQTVRPFLVTDGSKVVNRSNGGAFLVQNNTNEKKVQKYSEENIGSLEIRGKEKDNTIEHFNLENGSSDATLLLCLGMSFGILSSFMAHKREIEKLNRLLKQKENLVQDLEEELDMKDSLIMQELPIDDHNLQKNDDASPPASRDDIWEQLTIGNKKESVNQKPKDDSFSKIEAELEAELEMLELNMTSSSLERRISNLVELDPDFEPDVAQGELRADLLNKDANTNLNESGSTTTIPSANYAVSPRELSLRLHEVLESQLEERIKELEAEIESKRTQENHEYWKGFSSSDVGDENVLDEAVVLNLSGEALDAYNEACNEFAKIDESDEDDDLYSVESLLRRVDVDHVSRNDGQKDFDEDEMEKMLINRIVEKARQGSPVVLNAQRALFSE